jgi:transposase
MVNQEIRISVARYRTYSYKQGRLIPVFFEKQILPGTFEYTLNHLIDSELDLSIFDARYRNDDEGAPAYDPRILLKIILFAYSRGIYSSRKIAQFCKEHILFMALSACTHPHFTTIADFVSNTGEEVIRLFLEVLLVCDRMGLIGREMFAVDGVKMPSNASKEWSGTKEDLEKKAAKMEEAIRRVVEKHRKMDQEPNEEVMAKEEQYVETLKEQAGKIREWLETHEDKPGKTRKALKSNITDNESAKMKTSHGVVQGYDGVAVVDAKHQVVVCAEAFGEPQEHDLLEPMVQQTRKNFKAIGEEEDVFSQAKLTADSGFHTEKNMEMLSREGVDGYVADPLFRKRDPRFADRDRFKKTRKSRSASLFTPKDFTYDKEKETCTCPACRRLYVKNRNFMVKGRRGIAFMGWKKECRVCSLKSQCMRYPDRTEARQVYFFHGRDKDGELTFTEKMKRKIDSALGRLIYSRRIGTVEPVFANIRHTLGLDRFTLRGKKKVTGQWRLFCIVHNLLKVHGYGEAVAVL